MQLTGATCRRENTHGYTLPPLPNILYEGSPLPISNPLTHLLHFIYSRLQTLVTNLRDMSGYYHVYFSMYYDTIDNKCIHTRRRVTMSSQGAPCSNARRLCLYYVQTLFISWRHTHHIVYVNLATFPDDTRFFSFILDRIECCYLMNIEKYNNLKKLKESTSQRPKLCIARHYICHNEIYIYTLYTFTLIAAVVAGLWKHDHWKKSSNTAT